MSLFYRYKKWRNRPGFPIYRQQGGYRAWKDKNPPRQESWGRIGGCLILAVLLVVVPCGGLGLFSAYRTGQKTQAAPIQPAPESTLEATPEATEAPTEAITPDITPETTEAPTEAPTEATTATLTAFPLVTRGASPTLTPFPLDTRPAPTSSATHHSGPFPTLGIIVVTVEVERVVTQVQRVEIRDGQADPIVQTAPPVIIEYTAPPVIIRQTSAPIIVTTTATPTHTPGITATDSATEEATQQPTATPTLPPTATPSDTPTQPPTSTAIPTCAPTATTAGPDEPTQPAPTECSLIGQG